MRSRGEMDLGWLNRIHKPLAKGFHPTSRKEKQKTIYRKQHLRFIAH
jgi:hypothetical protein